MEENKTLSSESSPARAYIKKPDNAAGIPDAYVVISHKDYRHAISFTENDTAYMFPVNNLSDISRDKYGRPLKNNIPVPPDDLKKHSDLNMIKDIDLSLLRELYCFELCYHMEHPDKGYHHIQIYTPDLFKFAGKGFPKKEHINELMDKLENCCTLFGVIDGQATSVLRIIKEIPETNSIVLYMPYFTALIKALDNISSTSVKKSLKGKRTGKTNPVYTYAIKPTILKEKNQHAVDLVHAIVTTIEEAGANTPHISAQALIERNTRLKLALDNASASHKCNLIKRVFQATFSILRTQTSLEEYYPGIKLPDANDPTIIPSLLSLRNTVYKFKHKGKRK